MDNILTMIADNPALFAAVKEVVLEHFESSDLRTDEAIDDIRLGQMYRARLVGIQKVEEAFKEISSHRTRTDLSSNKNPAR